MLLLCYSISIKKLWDKLSVSDRLLNRTMHSDATFTCFVQNHEIDSVHSQRIIILNYAHFVVFRTQTLKYYLVDFCSCSEFVFIPLPISHELSTIFLRFCSFSHFRIQIHSILCCISSKTTWTSNLGQLIYGKWLSRLIKCIPCFSRMKIPWKMHWHSWCQKIKFNTGFLTMNHRNAHDNKHNAHILFKRI